MVAIDEFKVESSRRRLGSSNVDITVKLDIRQINDSLVDHDLRSNRAWARKLNNGVSTGIRNTGNKVLIIDNTKSEWLLIAIQSTVISSGAFLGEISIINTGLAITLGRNVAAVEVGGRTSFFIGPQIDRATILQARTRLQKVVKSAEELKK